MASIPTELSYTKDHEWARREADGRVRIGVTAYAVEQLGDVTLIDLPTAGKDVATNDTIGDIESVKTVSELFAPISGKIVEINAALEDQPELVNDSPYTDGWMLVIQESAPEEFDALILPNHEPHPAHKNIIGITGLLNEFSAEKLAVDAARFSDLPQPRVAVLLGGKHVGGDVVQADVDAILNKIPHS